MQMLNKTCHDENVIRELPRQKCQQRISKRNRLPFFLSCCVTPQRVFERYSTSMGPAFTSAQKRDAKGAWISSQPEAPAFSCASEGGQVRSFQWHTYLLGSKNSFLKVSMHSKLARVHNFSNKRCVNARGCSETSQFISEV